MRNLILHPLLQLLVISAGFHSSLTYLLVEIGEFEVEEAAGEAAEAQVRAEACRAGEQRVGVHSGTLEVGNPRLMKTVKGSEMSMQGSKVPMFGEEQPEHLQLFTDFK